MQKKTSLYEWHVQLGGRIVDFAGWAMPVQYSGVIPEHSAVRSAVGLFDVSHMGEMVVRGPGAKRELNRLITNDLDRIGDGQCQYSVVCYESGTVVDDVIFNQRSPDDFLIVVNATNREKDFSWFKQHLPATLDVQDVSDEYFLLALQGPNAKRVLTEVSERSWNDLKPFHFVEVSLLGVKVWISRTGYTGEDGFEIGGPWGQAPIIWQALMEAGAGHGILPVGLAARNTLRLEAAYSLYGHEISDTINPLEARLGWVVKLDKTEFIGKKALEEIRARGIKRALIGLEMVDRGIARDGCAVGIGREGVGWVTSGTYSPTLKKSIALGLVEKRHDSAADYWVEIRDQPLRAKKIPLPFYARK